jgi:hypothetical protein
VFARSGTKMLLWRAEGCHDEVVRAGLNASGEVWIVHTDFLGDPIQGLNESPIVLVNTRQLLANQAPGDPGSRSG